MRNSGSFLTLASFHAIWSLLAGLASAVVFLRHAGALALAVVRICPVVATANGGVVRGAGLRLAGACAVARAAATGLGFAEKVGIAANAPRASARTSYTRTFPRQGRGHDSNSGDQYLPARHPCSRICEPFHRQASSHATAGFQLGHLAIPLYRV